MSAGTDGVFDQVVVGAGIAGASVAWHLAAHGRVALLERESQPGYHATGRSAAMFMESYGTPMVRALTRASRAFYEQPPMGFAEHPILMPRGCMHVGQPGQEQALEAALALLGASSSRVERLSVSEVLACCPVLREDRVAGAVYEPDAMDMDVHALHQGYLRGLRARGGQVLLNAELAEARREGGCWSMRLADGRSLKAGAVVNAAGAWADVVAQRCGAPTIGLQPRRRTAFTFEPPAGADIGRWPTVIGIDESYYFKPDAGQLLGSPANADDVAPQDVQPEELDVAIGIHHIEEMTGLTIRRPRHTWAGLRSFAPDGDLVVGADAQTPGFFWVAAQGGYGIQTAAAAAELAAAQLLGLPLPEHFARFGVHAEALSPQRLRRTGPTP
jgi:D-arginine dehydrogenase